NGRDKDDDDEKGTKVASNDDHEEISDDNEGCNDDNVKDDDDDSDENVDDDDEMTELDNDKEDINLDERILTLKFHEEKDEEDYDDLYEDFNETSDLTTLLIQSTIAKSHENMVLAKSSLQPKSTYEATSSLTEFELKKVFFDKMNDSESYRSALKYKELYGSLSKSYNLDRDVFETYGHTYSLNRDREKKDKNDDLSTGSDQGLKIRRI
nr:hypothetical protein [Tanacetum cinerariifolium]